MLLRSHCNVKKRTHIITVGASYQENFIFSVIIATTRKSSYVGRKAWRFKALELAGIDMVGTLRLQDDWFPTHLDDTNKLDLSQCCTKQCKNSESIQGFRQ